MNITIIGGGTAGWLSAMYLNKRNPDFDITLVESKTIGIVGVGEGTVPNITPFLKNLGIDEKDFMSVTNATRKVGIAFDNWPNDGSSFNHDFFDGTYAYHFDTNIIGDYFKNIGSTRGINHIVDEVTGFEKEGDIIKSIHLANNKSISPDFVIDCSGFARLVIGKELKAEWISHKDHLTLNSAVTFRLPLAENEVFTEKSNTRTHSVSMKYGWMWMIPLQNRWGCGYVFDSKYINDEEAKKEVEEYFNRELKFGKKITFESGYFKDVWIGNSIAIGLSGGFFEPLEATSLMTVVFQLTNLLKNNTLDSSHREHYNTFVNKINYQVFNFIKYHYVCDRNDTQFWQDYKTHTLPETLTNLLDTNNRLKVFADRDIRNVIGVSPLDPYMVFSTYGYSIVSNGNFKKQNTLM